MLAYNVDGSHNNDDWTVYVLLVKEHKGTGDGKVAPMGFLNSN